MSALVHEYGRNVLLPGSDDRTLLDQREVDAVDKCIDTLLVEIDRRMKGRLPKRMNNQSSIGVVRSLRDTMMNVLGTARAVDQDLPKPPLVFADSE